MKPDPLPEWMSDDILKMEEKFFKCDITVVAEMSLQGKAKGNLEYSSTVVKIEHIFEILGRSSWRFNLSKGAVSLTSVTKF